MGVHLLNLIHPEMHRIITGPDKANPQGLENLKNILKVAENSGIHLMITGLACYKIKDRMAWYDSINEQDRWKTQAFFWETIARTCAESPAVIAYDLVNEPAATGKPVDGWYMGKMDDVEFCQRLSLNPRPNSPSCKRPARPPSKTRFGCLG